MSIHIAVLISLCIAITGSTGDNVIHKCCDVTQRFDHNLECVDILNSETRAVGENYRWIPSDDPSIIADITSQKISVKYGVTPNCTRNAKNELTIVHADKRFEFNLNTKHNEIFVEVLKNNVVHDSQNGRRTIFPSSSFCVDTGGEGRFAVILCPCSTNVQCVRKCCDGTALLDRTTGVCHEVQDDINGTYKMWTPRIEYGQKKAVYHLLDTKPECKAEKLNTFSMTSLDEGNMESNLLLLEDDRIENTEDGEVFLAEEYCGDYSTDHEEILLFCAKSDKETEAIQTVYGVLSIIDAIAILVTVLLTIVMPDMRKNVQAEMAFCHNIALLMVDSMDATVYLGAPYTGVSSVVLNFATHFSVLVAYFWLNAMCIDMAWAFSALRSVRAISSQKSRKKFIYYSLYAWGTPSCIMITMVIIQFTPGANWRPSSFADDCISNNCEATTIFFHIPIALMTFANTSLFVYTIIRIMKAKSDPKVLNENDAGAKKQEEER